MHRCLAAAAAAAVLVAGCRGGEETPARSDSRDTLVIATPADIGNLISVVSEAATDSDINQAISFPMIEVEFDCSLKKNPGLAERWEWSEDGTVLSMWLRDDITFSDGEPLEAADIALTYDLVADPEVSSPRMSYVQRMEPDGRPRVIGPHHVEWHFTEAYDRDTQVAHAGAIPILPEHVFRDVDRSAIRSHPYAKSPLSSGPWKLARYEPNSRIVLEPNEAFAGPDEYRPRLDRVVFRILPEYQSRLIALQNGDVDLVAGLTVADADRLRQQSEEIRLVRRSGRDVEFIGWNLENPLFQDVRVRRALAMAVDVEDMMAKLLTSRTGEVYAQRAVGTVTPALCGVHNDEITPLPHDPDRARELLAEAGWTDSDDDGWLDKDGRRFEFTLSTNTGNQRRADSAILVQAYLDKVGIKVNIEQQDALRFFENTRLGNYEAALMGWVAALFVDPSGVWHCDTEDEHYELNFVHYCNPEVDELIDRGLQTSDPREAAPTWKELQARVYQDQPYLFLFWIDEIVGVHDRFENTQIDVQSAIGDLHEWSVPPDEIKYE